MIFGLRFSRTQRVVVFSLICLFPGFKQNALFAQTQSFSDLSERHLSSEDISSEKIINSELDCDDLESQIPNDDRWNLVHDLYRCLEQYGDRMIDKEVMQEITQENSQVIGESEPSKSRVDALEARAEFLEDRAFSTTTKLSLLTILGAQYGDTVGDRPLIRPFSGNVLRPSRPSALATSFFTLNSSFIGDDLLKITMYSANAGKDTLSQAQIGNSQSNNGIRTLFMPTRTVWSLIPSSMTLYRLMYQFKPASDLEITVGPKFYATDILDRNSYTNPITSFNSWSMVSNSLIHPYELRLLGGAGLGVDWDIDGGPFSLKGVYLARRANVAASDTEGGLFNAPYQGSVELEYRDKLSASDHLALKLQYSHTDSGGVEQDVMGVNAELGLGNLGLFGRFGYSWANAEPGVNPLPFSAADAGTFETALFKVGFALKDFGLDSSLLSVAVGQPFRTTLEPAPGIEKEYQTNVEAFYRIPLGDRIFVSPTLLTVFNPNNRDDQPTIMQGFLRFTFIY